MFNLSQVTLTPGRKDGELIGRFILDKEQAMNFVPGAYDILFRPDGTPRSLAGAYHLEGGVEGAQVRQFPNGKKITTKSDLEDVALKAREDGKIAGTCEIEDPKLAALFTSGVPCEIEGTSPWVPVAGGNGHARASSMEKRTKTVKRKYIRKDQPLAMNG